MTTPAFRYWDRLELPLEPDVVRVELEADSLVEEALRKGELVHVRAPRKTGKSSLALLVADRLTGATSPGDRRHVVRLDLWQASAERDAELFLVGLDERQVSAFQALVGQAGLPAEEAVRIRSEAGATIDWFWRACRLVAKATRTPVVVFADEIEEVLGEQRAIGEAWLVALRQIHQDAGGDLAVCLLGLLPASMLVRSPERTPFNTVREVRLKEYDMTQVEGMASRMAAWHEGRDYTAMIAQAVFRETAGQPNLTQWLLGKLSDRFARNPETIPDFADLVEDILQTEPECSPTTTNTYMHVKASFTKPSVWPRKAALVVYGNMFKAVANAGRNADPAVVYEPWSDAHLMLEAMGLARVESRNGQRLLVARCRIARRMFGLAWATAILTGLGGEAAPAAGATSPDLARMEAVAREELCRSDWAVEHNASVVAGSGLEMVEGALFQFELIREKPQERLTLQMFRGVGDFGKLLWLRQVRTLRHLSGRAVALPKIVRGGLLDGDQVAYIITQRPELTLADAGFHDYVRSHRSWALEQLVSMADGLKLMAAEGISHRNIWPGSIRTDQPDDNSSPPAMMLANFEFSVMLRSMLGSGDDPAVRAQGRRAALRRAFLHQPPTARPFASPELLAGLFQDDAPLPSKVTSDVFSLGMVAVSWFVDPLDPAAFSAVLPATGPDTAAYDAAAHAAYIEALVADIERAVQVRRLPAALGRVLQGMIAADPNSRLRPVHVLEKLQDSAALSAWATGERTPLLACYSYLEMASELARRGAMISPVGSEASKVEVEKFLETALAGAELYHSPQGLAPFVADPEPGHSAAQWVLKGSAWIFYCQRFERREEGFGALRTLTPHILRLAYVWPINRTWGSAPRKTVRLATFGPLKIVEQRGSPEMEPRNEHKYRAWDPVLASAMRLAMAASFEIAQVGFNWLVDALRQEQEMKRFPVAAVSDAPLAGGRRERTYAFDEKAYRTYIERSRMRSAIHRSGYFSDHRDRFEQVMQQARAADGRLRMRSLSDGGVPDGPWGTADLLEVRGATIRMKGPSLPKRAWVEPEEVARSRRPIEQQAHAAQALDENPALFDQLLDPYVVVDDQTIGENELKAAVDGLLGRVPEIVRKFVTSGPLTALQGPPGTGKTTVIAAVVRALLSSDPTFRVLITSQSNAAVDNIADRIMDLGLGADDQIICARVGSDEAFGDEGVISERVRAWRPEVVAERLAEKIRKSCAEQLEGRLHDGLRAAYEQLASAARDGAIELSERVRESAALVFATTAGSQRVANEGYLPPGGRFDLAVVDEASKAQPTEIIQPMLLAERQLLVGDHLQLPAFDSTSIRNLLRECAQSSHEEFRVIEKNRTAIEAWLRLFASFFNERNEKYVETFEQARLPGWRDERKVAEQLTLQFRMRSDIADVVSHSFYDGKLESAEGVDHRERPAWLRSLAAELDVRGGLLWVDTRAGELFTSADQVVNEDQAKLAARLLVHAHALGAGGRSAAVVLSPYKAQNRAIEKQLAALGRPELASAVRTVDSFQGQEADLVILSLTRSPGVGERDGGRATARYGFMVSPERVNVMFSRARELLVVLGDYNFFAAAKKVEDHVNPGAPVNLKFWETLCNRIERKGLIVDNENLPPKLRVR